MTSRVAQDLGTGALRGLCLAAIVGLPVAAVLLLNSAPLAGWASAGATLAGLGLIAVPTAALEGHGRRGAGLGWQLGVIWALAWLGLVLAGLQGTYVYALVASGSPAAGLAEVGDILAHLLQEPVTSLAPLAGLAIPFAVVAALGAETPQLARRASWRSLAFGAPLLLVGGCGAMIVLAIAAVLIAWSYRAAEQLRGLVARRRLDPARDALSARVARGELRFGQLWLLAHLEDPAARRLLGPRAPELIDPLEPWVGRFEAAGVEPSRRAAVAALRALLPHLARADAERVQAIVALAAAACPDAATVDLAPARALLAELPRGEPAHDACAAALVAVGERSGFARTLAAQHAARAARAAARRAGPAEVRQTIQSEVLAWALEGQPPRRPELPPREGGARPYSSSECAQRRPSVGLRTRGARRARSGAAARPDDGCEGRVGASGSG